MVRFLIWLRRALRVRSLVRSGGFGRGKRRPWVRDRFPLYSVRSVRFAHLLKALYTVKSTVCTHDRFPLYGVCTVTTETALHIS